MFYANQLYSTGVRLYSVLSRRDKLKRRVPLERRIQLDTVLWIKRRQCSILGCPCWKNTKPSRSRNFCKVSLKLEIHLSFHYKLLIVNRFRKFWSVTLRKRFGRLVTNFLYKTVIYLFAFRYQLLTLEQMFLLMIIFFYLPCIFPIEYKFIVIFSFRYLSSLRVRMTSDISDCDAACAHVHFCAITRADYHEFRSCVRNPASALASRAPHDSAAILLYAILILISS